MLFKKVIYFNKYWGIFCQYQVSVLEGLCNTFSFWKKHVLKNKIIKQILNDNILVHTKHIKKQTTISDVLSLKEL